MKAFMGYAGTWDEPACYDSAFFSRYQNKITHLIHFKVGPQRNAPFITWEMGSAKHDQMATLFVTGAHAVGMKVLLCIGGVGTEAQEWNYITADRARCQHQVDVFAQYAKDRGYDGLDLDWETDITKDGFIMLSQMLRAALDAWSVNGVATRGILSCAVGREWNAVQDVPTLNALYDNIWIMTYDGNSNGSWVSGFHEEVYNTSSEYPLLATEYDNSIDTCSAKWVAHGLDKTKTSLIFGAYGYAWQSGCGHPVLVPGHINNPAHACAGKNPAHNAWQWELWKIRYFQSLHTTGVVNHDELAMMAWWSDPTNPLQPPEWGHQPLNEGFSYINYNDEWAITKKTDYTFAKGWGGIALCGFGNGYLSATGTPAQRWPLIETIANKLSSGSTPVLPVITVQPLNITAVVGGIAVFTVSATSPTPMTYQWSLNGVAIAGATSASYATSPLTMAANGGRFTCVVGNADGSISSTVGVLTVTTVVPPMDLEARVVALEVYVAGVQAFFNELSINGVPFLIKLLPTPLKGKAPQV